MVTVRKSSDLLTAQQLHVLEFGEGGHISDDSIAWYARRHPRKWSDIMGYATARPMGDILYLNSASILRPYRGLGIHRKLIQARVRYAKRQGMSTVITYTAYDNCASINNLIACGFKTFRPEYEWVGSEYIYWRKSCS